MVKALTGKDSGGRVLAAVEASEFKNGKNSDNTAWYKLQSDKKGDFIKVKGAKYYVELPAGEFVKDKFGCSKWVNA